MKYDLKVHVRSNKAIIAKFFLAIYQPTTFMLWRRCVIYKSSYFFLNYNFEQRSHGQLLFLFLIYLHIHLIGLAYMYLIVLYYIQSNKHL